MKLKGLLTGLLSIGAVLLFGLLIYVNFQPNNENSKSINAENINEDIQTTENQNLTLSEAQKLVTFDAKAPKTPEGFKNPLTFIKQPPKGAVSDKNEAKEANALQLIYESKTSKKEGILVYKTNNELIQSDPKTGETLKPNGTIDVNGLKVNYYDCNCKPSGKTYSWYDGNTSTQVQVIGNIPENKLISFLSELK